MLETEQRVKLAAVLKDAAEFCREGAQSRRMAADVYGDDEEISGELHKEAIVADNLAERLEAERNLLLRDK